MSSMFNDPLYPIIGERKEYLESNLDDDDIGYFDPRYGYWGGEDYGWYWAGSSAEADKFWELYHQGFFGNKSGSQTPASQMPGGKTQPTSLNVMMAGLGQRLPLAYGHVVLPARVTAFGLDGNDPVMQLTWCGGEINSIIAVRSSQGDAITSDITNYLGTSGQTEDSRLAAAITDYADGGLADVAYSSLKVDLANGGVQTFVAEVEGKKCFDPRTSTTIYTQNPAIMFRDVAILGGLTPDDDSIEATADECDALINGAPRRQCNIYFDTPMGVNEILHILAEYAGGIYVRDAGEAKLIAHRPRAIGQRFTDDPNYFGTGVQIKEGTLKVKKSTARNKPNRVNTSWTDTTVWPWRKRYAGTTVIHPEDRPTTFEMDGYHSHEEANRHSIERYNGFIASDLEVELEAFDDAFELEVGDRFTVDSHLGLSNKDFWATEISAGGDLGHWRIKGKEYDAALFSDDVTTGAVLPDTLNPSPADIPTGPTPTATEKLFVEEGGRTLSRLEVTWSGTDWGYVKGYRVVVLEGSSPILEEFVTHRGPVSHMTATPPVAQGVLYTINVYIVNVFHTVGATPGSDTITGQGKLLKPSAPGPISQGFEVGLFVYLEWSEASDIDLAGYRIKRISKTAYDLNPSGAWSDANASIVANRVDATNHVLAAQPVGTYVFMIKALDSLDQESTSWVEKQVEITTDAAASIGTGEVGRDAAGDNNVHAFRIPGIDVLGGDFVASTDGATWVERFGAAGTFWTVNASAGDTWHEDMTNASGFASETWDTGSDRQGNWVWSLSVLPIKSPTMVYTTRIAKNATPSTFTDFSGQSAHAEGQYLRCKVRNTATTAGAGFLAKLNISTSYQGVELYDVQTVTITAAQMPNYQHNFTEPFSAAPEVTIDVLNGDARLVARDNTTKDKTEITCWQVGASGGVSYADTTVEIKARGT